MTSRPRLTTPLLGALSFFAAVGPLATDMYLASFTEIAVDLGTAPSSVQLTLTAFLLGMGFGQLFLGPLSDQFGRRPVLLWALAVFTAASVAMVFSPSISLFVLLRGIQGFAGAGGVVISRAIAVDLSEGPEAIRAISLIAMFVGLGPLIAPPLGGAISAVADWRAVLAAISVLAVAMLVLAATMVPESLPAHARRAAGIGTALGSFRALLGDRGFVTLMIVFGLGFGAMMAYISASPFIGQAMLGMPPFVYALGFAAGALGLILTNLLNARLAGRVETTRMLFAGTGLQLAAALALILAIANGWLAIPFFIAFAFTLTSGAALVMSNASALALARAGANRGSGSALLGAAQFAVGGFASPLVGAWGEHTALPMALFVLVAAMLGSAGALLHARRAG